LSYLVEPRVKLAIRDLKWESLVDILSTRAVREMMSPLSAFYIALRSAVRLPLFVSSKPARLFEIICRDLKLFLPRLIDMMAISFSVLRAS
jgi:hypothetical protein